MIKDYIEGFLDATGKVSFTKEEVIKLLEKIKEKEQPQITYWPYYWYYCQCPHCKPVIDWTPKVNQPLITWGSGTINTGDSIGYIDSQSADLQNQYYNIANVNCTC